MIEPRSTIGVPEPPASRRKLSGVGWILAHEIGVNTPETGRYRSDDPARVLDDVQAVARFGASSKRTWEYSHILGRDGSIFEQAGEFRGQHCLDFNEESVGVLFANASGLAPTDGQIEAWHWLRADLVRRGVLAADHQVAPHYRFRTTSCPGVLAEPPGVGWVSPTGEGRRGDLIPALLTAPVPPLPPVEESPEMIAIDYEPGQPGWTALTWTGTHLAWCFNGHADKVVRGAGVRRVTVSRDELLGIIASSRTTTAIPSTFANDPTIEAAWLAAQA